MADMLLNGREPLSWELPAVERGRRQELERDCELVAGLVAEEPPPLVPDGTRPVANLPGLS